MVCTKYAAACASAASAATWRNASASPNGVWAQRMFWSSLRPSLLSLASLYLMRSSSSACTMTMPPASWAIRMAARTDPWFIRMPAWPVVTSVVNTLNEGVPCSTAVAMLARVSAEAEPVITGWKAKSTNDRPVKISLRWATASVVS